MKRLLPLLLLFGANSYAQIENCSSFKRLIDKIVSAKATDNVDPDVMALIDVGQTGRCFAQYLSGVGTAGQNKDVFQKFVQAFEGARTDKQAGAGAGGSGSTSPVAQGAIAKSLSVATEYGALTQSVSGQVITITGNVAGLPSALVRNDIFPYCVGDEKTNSYCVSSSLLSLLRRLSFSASFDASRDNQTLTGTGTGSTGSGTGATPTAAPQPVTFTGKKRELTVFSARLELWDARDATSKKFQDAWRSKVGQSMDASSGALLTAGQALTAVQDAPWYNAWFSQALGAMRAAGRDRQKLAGALNDALRDFASHAQGVVTPAVVAAAQRAYNNFFLAQDDLIDTLAKSSVIAVEYTDKRPLGQAPVNTMRLIADMPLGAQAKITANGAIDFYGSVPQMPGLSRFRDAQAGVEIDYGILGGKSIAGPATLSGAGYYQYQHSSVLLNVDATSPLSGITFSGLPANAGTVFAKTGSIWLAQIKLSVAPSGKSVKIPLSVTYSNRTELLNKPTWRAQIGVAYDFDSLASLLAAKK